MHSIEAIVLKASRFQEHKQILKLFSKERGIVSIITNTRKVAFSPLLRVEAQLLPAERELKKCKEIHVVGSYQALRLSLDKLQLAAGMLDFVGRELPEEEPVIELYELLESCLREMCETNEPKRVADSFYREWKLFSGE